MPRSGWLLVGTDDLEDLSGECELCGTALRYVFAIVHPMWGAMAVGTDCCDKLTATEEASRLMDSQTKRRDKLARFVESPKWKQLDSGASMLVRKGSTFRIEPEGPIFTIAVNGARGRRSYQSVIEARKHLFNILESGEAEAFIAKQRRHRILGEIRAQREGDAYFRASAGWVDQGAR